MKKLILISLFVIPFCRAAAGPESDWESKGKEEEEEKIEIEDNWAEDANWNKAIQEAKLHWEETRLQFPKMRRYQNPLEGILELLLKDKKIKTLPDNFYLPNLRELDLTNNQIAYVDPEIFIKLPRLQILMLKGNPLYKDNVDELINITKGLAGRYSRIIVDENLPHADASVIKPAKIK